jgi:hypothetical protein
MTLLVPLDFMSEPSLAMLLSSDLTFAAALDVDSDAERIVKPSKTHHPARFSTPIYGSMMNQPFIETTVLANRSMRRGTGGSTTAATTPQDCFIGKRLSSPATSSRSRTMSHIAEFESSWNSQYS